MQNKEWLPHLTNEMMLGARNNNLCSYVIALEGWRRGLTLTFYSKKVKKDTFHVPGCLFSLSDGNETHVFYKSRGSRVKGEAFTIGGSKIKTKQTLEKHGVPVPKGDIFSKDASNEEIISFANKIGYPVVLKPSNAAQGKGVIANITNEEFLRKSLMYVREDLNYKEVIVEEFVSGEEYRFYVLEDEVLAVLNRRPANITGDGTHTIKQLIDRKNKERKKNPRLFSCLIQVDFEIKNMLQKNNLTLESVPSSGEVIYLRQKSNITSGGDSIDQTDEIPEEIKQVAINALKCIPNFPNGGVDIIIDHTKPVNEAAKVIELTPVPQIGSLVFPMEGKPRDIPAALIDYYFPQTKQLRNNNPNIYFSLPSILEPLNEKSASEITVIPCPTFIETQIKYKITGKVQKVGFRRWIRKKALEADLYGYAENQKDGSLIVALAGTTESIKKFKKTCEIGPAKAKVNEVIEQEWVGAVRVGFEIKKNPPATKKVKSVKKPIQKQTNKQVAPTNTKSISLLSRLKRKLKK